MAIDEVVLGILVAIAANGFFDAVVVAWLAGRRSKTALVAWLQDEEQAGPYYDKIAERAAVRATEKISPTINAKLEDVHNTVAHLEARISAEMPHPDVAIADMKAELEAKVDELQGGLEENLQAVRVEVHGQVEGIDKGIQAALAQLDGIVENLPDRIKMALLSARGVAARKMNAAAGEAVEGMIDESGLLDEISSPESELEAWLRAPVKEDAERPWVSGGMRILKARLAQEFGLGRGRASAPPGNGGGYEPVR